MSFFHFHQNNTGGSFDLTDTLTRDTIIEAVSADDANAKLQELGGYFNGCAAGLDCDCCGDRWHPVDDADADPEPNVYGSTPTDRAASSPWMPAGKNVVVHYADSRVEWF